MTHQDLLDLGSQLEAHATMAPGTPISIDPMRVAHMLMWAAREIEILKGRK